MRGKAKRLGVFHKEFFLQSRDKLQRLKQNLLKRKLSWLIQQPEKNSEPLEYSEIILSGNYNCMESASIKADGDLPKFVKEFNIFNS